MSNRYTFEFTKNKTDMKIDVYGNFDPNNVNSSIKEVVVMQHGTGRNASGYADIALKSAQLHDEKAGSYGVVAVDFSVSGEQGAGEPYWTNNGWKQGDLSVDASYGPRVSSFEVMNLVADALSDNLPNLEKVVFAGHSAGGQFMNRYAAGADISSLEGKGVDVGFVAANPSSHMWFDTSIPYKYGEFKLNDYMSKLGADKLAYNMDHRDYAVFAGDKDTFDEGDLDTSKLAMDQGDNRWERAVNYFDHLQDTFNNPDHIFVDAPGVDHSGGDMFTSPNGIDLLWG